MHDPNQRGSQVISEIGKEEEEIGPDRAQGVIIWMVFGKSG
jgi:hypothetical protein